MASIHQFHRQQCLRASVQQSSTPLLWSFSRLMVVVRFGKWVIYQPGRVRFGFGSRKLCCAGLGARLQDALNERQRRERKQGRWVHGLCMPVPCAGTPIGLCSISLSGTSTTHAATSDALHPFSVVAGHHHRREIRQEETLPYSSHGVSPPITLSRLRFQDPL